MCPTCKTTNYSLIYDCPLLGSTKGQEKDYSGYRSNDSSLGYVKVDTGERGNIRHAQISLVSILPAPVIGPSDHSHLQDVHFDTRVQ